LHRSAKPRNDTRVKSVHDLCQAGLRLLRSSRSNAAVIEEFSIQICNLHTDTSMEVCYLPVMLYNIGGSKEETSFKVHSKRMTYILVRMSHDGNLILIKFQGGDKENY
jgi:hypothetical protein